MQADLGDDGLGGDGAAAGDLIQPATAGSTGAPGPVPTPGPVVPSASTPCAAGIASISSLTRADSWSIWVDTDAGNDKNQIQFRHWVSGGGSGTVGVAVELEQGSVPACTSPL